MKSNSKKIDIIDAMDRHHPGWRCTFDNWREKANEYRDRCAEKGEETGLTLLQSRWEAGIGNNMKMCEEIVASSDSPMDALAQCLEYSLIPPPEILLVLEDMFRTYRIGGGGLTLEEAFFGKPIRGKGSYAARGFGFRNPDNRYLKFERYLNLQSENGQQMPLSRSAEKYFEKRRIADSLELENNWNTSPCAAFEPGESTDIDSFLRSYRRWRKNRSNTDE